MNAEVMILMDTECSGRYFDVRTYNDEAFHTMQELKRLCETTRHEDSYTRYTAPLQQYPAKGKLTSLHVSIYATDQNGVHGVLHVSPSRHVIFRSSDELQVLIHRESSRALRKQRTKTYNPCGIPIQNTMESVSPC